MQRPRVRHGIIVANDPRSDLLQRKGLEEPNLRYAREFAPRSLHVPVIE
jgi:hypothetical protein